MTTYEHDYESGGCQVLPPPVDVQPELQAGLDLQATVSEHAQPLLVGAHGCRGIVERPVDPFRAGEIGHSSFALSHTVMTRWNLMPRNSLTCFGRWSEMSMPAS